MLQHTLLLFILFLLPTCSPAESDGNKKSWEKKDLHVLFLIEINLLNNHMDNKKIGICRKGSMSKVYDEIVAKNNSNYQVYYEVICDERKGYARGEMLPMELDKLKKNKQIYMELYDFYQEFGGEYTDGKKGFSILHPSYTTGQIPFNYYETGIDVNVKKISRNEYELRSGATVLKIIAVKKGYVKIMVVHNADKDKRSGKMLPLLHGGTYKYLDEE